MVIAEQPKCDRSDIETMFASPLHMCIMGFVCKSVVVPAAAVASIRFAALCSHWLFVCVGGQWSEWQVAKTVRERNHVGEIEAGGSERG